MEKEKKKKDNLVKLKQQYTIFIILLLIAFGITTYFIIKDKDNIIREVNEIKEEEKEKDTE